MAAAVGPEVVMDSFTYASKPRHIRAPSATVDMTSNNSESPSTIPQLSPSPRSAPLPNPPFVFPMRSTPSSAPSSYSRATGRRPRASIAGLEMIEGSTRTSLDVDAYSRPSRASLDVESPRRAPGPMSLPAFSFPMAPASGSPSADGDMTLLSPPHSPNSSSPASPRMMPNRPAGAGHRRGASEFVGGSIRGGDSIQVLGTSPTKSDFGHVSPNLKPTNAARRHARGHSHKRSGAISSHDLSSIMLPPKLNPPGMRGGSAPTSPANFDRTDELIFPMTGVSPDQEHPTEINEMGDGMRRPSASAAMSNEEPEQPENLPPRVTKVGFSDTLEYIPRPISMVSTETSSTSNTIRPSHSVSGSISSLISLTVSNTADREVSPPRSTPPNMSQNEGFRPSTAGAVLERTLSMTDLDQAPPLPKRRNSIPHLIALPPPTATIAPATPSPTKTPKRWSFFGLEPFVGASSPVRSRPVSAGSSDSQSKTAVADEPADVSRPVSSGGNGFPALQKVPTKKRSKKQKRVKVWAGSILSRKSKSSRQAKHKRRSMTPTPPPARMDDEYEDDTGRPSFDMLSEPPMVVISEAFGQNDGHASPPQRPASLPDEDTSFPMIDLDAALGPFNTPLPRNFEWEAAQRAGGLVKKQLHSASKMNRFTGPGMHYQHRRAESAPEMVPFEGAGRFGLHRFGSSSTMADVFEEDEEEDDEESEGNRTTGNSTPMAETPGEKSTDPLGATETDKPAVASFTKDDVVSVHSGRELLMTPFGIRRKGSDMSEDEKSQFSSRMRSEHGGTSLHEEVIVEEYDHDDLPSPGPPQWDRSPSATPSPRQMYKSKDLTPVDVSPLNLPASTLAPGSPYSMTQSSSFPSPRTPVSYDTQRMSTAPSSITDYRSLLMGEPGPEVRISVDGVPSLTSSNSTMTRESLAFHNPQARVPPLSNDLPRPASFSSTAFGRRRSSLASLSRLISSSHGERSKLSMEVPMDNGSDPEKKLPKASKTKRLSRLVQFWRPKDSKDAKDTAEA